MVELRAIAAACSIQARATSINQKTYTIMKKSIFCAIALTAAMALTSCGNAESTETIVAEQQQQQECRTYEPGQWYAIEANHADMFEAAGYKVERRDGVVWRYFI